MYARSLLPAVLIACLVAPAGAAALQVSGLVLEAPAAAKVSLLPLQSNHAWRVAVLAGRAAPDPAAVVEAGGTGRFVLTAPSPGMWSVVVTAQGRVPMRYLPVPVTDPVELPPLELVADAGLEVRVLWKDGRPAAGAWVLLTTGSPDLLRTLRADGWQVDSRIGRTDAEGRLKLPRVAGEEVKVHAFAQGARRAAATVPAGMARAELVLEPSAGGRIVEVRDPSGAPVAGAAVSAGSPAWPAGVTGLDGRLSLPVDAEGPFDLLLADGGRHKMDALPAERIDLPALRRLEGKVLDAASRKPLAWALVWPGDDPGNVTFTGPGGTYTVAERAGGRAWVQVEASGFQPASAKLPQAPGAVPTLALAPAGTLAGRVLDKGGAPLGNVAVTAAPDRRARGEVFRLDRAASRALSDAEGRFLLRGLAPAPTYDLTASRSGYQAAQATVAAGGEARLVLERARSAHGVVTDDRGRPLAGAEVTVASASGEAVAARTDDRGRFQVPALPADRVDLEARRQGFAPAVVPGVVVAPGPGPADLGTLALLPGVKIEGQVADAEGRPLSGTGVWLTGADRPPGRALAEKLRQREPAATADESGRFAIPDVARGRRVNVLLAREGYVPLWLAGVEAPTPRPVAAVLEPASRLRGRVEDVSGEPVPGASVRLRPAPPPPGTVGVEVRRSENTADVETGHDGTFAFAEVAPGAVTLEASAEGFVPPEPVELQMPPDGEVRDVRLVLGRGAAVGGSITVPGGEPVAGARVRIGPLQSESDAEGRYRLAGVSPGLKGLAVSHPAYKGRNQQIDVQAGENRVDLTLEKGTAVSGRVVDEVGEPRPGAELTLKNRSERGPRGYRASSSAGGRFEILAVADGSFDLEAEADGFAPATHPAVIEVAGRDVEGLEVVLRRGATLSGRILGLEPGQMAAVEVTAERGGRPARAGTVDYAGRYEITALEAGDWHLRARLSGGRREVDAWVAIALGDREVERDLKLGGGLALDGLVLIEDRPLPQARVSLRGLDVAAERGVTTDHQGAFGFEDLEPGRYRVEVTHSERMLSQSEDLDLAADREVVIEIATAVLAGRVVAAGSGEGVAEALVHLQRLLGGAEPGPLTTVGTDAAGSFVTASLAPGRYRLTVRGDGYAQQERTVDVEAGVPAEPLTIELEPTEGLEILVRRTAGEPPVWATVIVLDEGGRPVHVEEPRLSDRGRGYLQQVPPGRWTFLVKAGGSAATLASATVPGRRLEVTLPPGAPLTVRVPALLESRAGAALTLAAADGAPHFGVNPGGYIQQSWPLAGGVATVPDVPAGAWQLKVTAADGRTWSASLSTDGKGAAAAVIE